MEGCWALQGVVLSMGPSRSRPVLPAPDWIMGNMEIPSGHFLAGSFNTTLWLMKNAPVVSFAGWLHKEHPISCMKMLLSLRILCRAGRRNKRFR